MCVCVRVGLRGWLSSRTPRRCGTHTHIQRGFFPREGGLSRPWGQLVLTRPRGIELGGRGGLLSPLAPASVPRPHRTPSFCCHFCLLPVGDAWPPVRASGGRVTSAPGRPGHSRHLCSGQLVLHPCGPSTPSFFGVLGVGWRFAECAREVKSVVSLIHPGHGRALIAGAERTSPFTILASTAGRPTSPSCVRVVSLAMPFHQ